MRRLPLGPIEAFVSVARAGSLAQAATVMNLTVPALSRRIRLLEAHLGVELFKRLPRGLELTEAGTRYFASLAPAWDAVESATDAARYNPRTRAFRISVMPSFAASWLAPRLGRFHAKYENLGVQIETSPDLVELAAHPELDAVIRLGKGPWPGLTGDAFLSVSASPVASPELLNAIPPLEHPKDLLGQRLIGTHHQPEFWREWFKAAGIEAAIEQRDSFDNLQVAYEAAAAGMGIALGITPVISPYIETGRLRCLFSVSVPSLRRFHLLRRSNRTPSRSFLLFRDWLLREAARSEHPTAASSLN
jgi:LysR family transcriptional regulator, glycine cleavage system transcriptional activator